MHFLTTLDMLEVMAIHLLSHTENAINFNRYKIRREGSFVNSF